MYQVGESLCISQKLFWLSWSINVHACSHCPLLARKCHVGHGLGPRQTELSTVNFSPNKTLFLREGLLKSKVIQSVSSSEKKIKGETFFTPVPVLIYISLERDVRYYKD